MIPDKESWCDSLIPIVILEAIDVIRNQLRTPRLVFMDLVFMDDADIDEKCFKTL